MYFSKSSSRQKYLDPLEIWLGFKHLLPISCFVAIFGAAFGLAATQVGLDSSSILLMSGLVFAGASQFAALELWGEQVSLLPLVISVFFINARHILMGASLYPWLEKLPTGQRYLSLLFISDANWAMALHAFQRGQSGLGLLFGGGIALWLFWLIGTGLGLYLGNLIAQPALFGLDMVMACFLLSMVLGGQKNLRVVWIWTVAAISSLLAYWYLPENSHVVVGALMGGFAGLYWKEQRA